ncbi:MAG: o-succinylbenzoate synthase [Chloroflexi bacterium]|nr:o-succinylbenzoate synthase [Chloroflexota bacterium]
MIIEQIELYHISMPLVAPFETSFGVETDRECIIVAAHADGLTGWGECVASADPGYCYETVKTAWHILEDFLIPATLGREFDDIPSLAAAWSGVRGHPLAKAGLQMAVWDLIGRAQGLPLQKLLGGQGDRVRVGVSVGIQPSREALVERIRAYLAEGYPRIKIKIKPGKDVEYARAVREAFPEILLQVDANSAYRLEDAPTIRAMDDLNLLLIEQPLGYDDIFDHAKLQAQVKTPICLDESIHSPDHARWALELSACRIINIKAARVGGLYEAVQIHDLCRARGVPVWCGGMLETGIGRASNLALASLPGFTLPGDISATNRYYHEDIADPPFMLNSDGTINVPTGPGLGVRVRMGVLERVTKRKGKYGN